MTVRKNVNWGIWLVYQSVFWPMCILVFRIGNKSGKYIGEVAWGYLLGESAGEFTRGICLGILLEELLAESAQRICWGNPVKFIRHGHRTYRPLQWHLA